MEPPNGPCPRLNTITTNREKPHTQDLQTPEKNDSGNVFRPDHEFRYTGAFEIARETMRIFRYNQSAFIAIWALLICPVSIFHLSDMLVDQSIVKRVSMRLLLIAKSSGLPLNPFVKQTCYKFSETVTSSIVCFPFYITLLLISKAAVVYAVDCTYSRKKFDYSKFYVILQTIWRRIISTYLLICAVNISFLILCILLLIVFSNLFSTLQFPPNSFAYTAIAIGFFFLVLLANTIIICDLSLVISVLEDVSGFHALLRSSVMIRSQTRIGLITFIGSTIGMVLIKGLFEHRVKSLSYRNGPSKLWEEPVLVLTYSFVVLIDFMMNTIFYISCRSYTLKASTVDRKPVLETMTVSIASLENRVGTDSSCLEGKKYILVIQ